MGLDARKMMLLAEVARCGSITGAAQKLSYTPSAISQQIARLEREIGQPVLERHPRGIGLTEAGSIIVKHAENIDREMDAALSEVSDLAGLRAGVVRIAAFPTAAETLLPPIVAAFRRAHPAVQIALRCATLAGLHEMVDRREVDLAVMWDYDWCRIEKPNVEMVHLVDDPLCIMVPRSHRLADAEEVEISALANERWITRDGHYVAEVLTRYCRAAGFEPQIIYEASDYQEIQAMVAMALGIAMVPGFALISLRDDVAVIRLGSEAPSRRVILAHFGERANAPAARVLCDLLIRTAHADQSLASTPFAVPFTVP